MKINNKKIIILILFIVTILIFKKFVFVSNKVYEIRHDGNKFIVSQNKNKNNYNISIKKEKTIYTFNIYEKIKSNKIIDDIYYYKDENYECILPIINGNIYNDMICYYKDILYNYHDIKNNNKKLDDYVNSIKQYSYNNYLDDVSKTSIIDQTKFYINNIKKNVFLTSYSGLVNSLNEIKLFEKDVYTNKLSVFADNYYLVADYNKEHSFNSFYLVNLIDNKVDKIKFRDEMSFDSYIQGYIDKIIYIYDKDNECQYEINVEKKQIVSNNQNIKYYKNGKWTTISKAKAKQNMLFDYDTLENSFSDYYKVIKTTDYYYLFKKNSDNYTLYRVDINNINTLTYLLTLKTDQIYYDEDYIYYIYKNKLFYYSDSTGVRTMLENNELEYNETIKYYIN